MTLHGIFEEKSAEDEVSRYSKNYSRQQIKANRCRLATYLLRPLSARDRDLLRFSSRDSNSRKVRLLTIARTTKSMY